MIKSLIIRVILRIYPNFFLTQSGFNILYQQKLYKVNFINDYYIYKNVDNGYPILYGEFNLAGEKILFNNFDDDIFNLHEHLQKELHSFSWLQNLKVVDNETASLRIIELFTTWIEKYGTSKNQLVFNNNVLANRLFNWLTSSRIINFSDENFRNKFYANLSFQIRLFLKVYKVRKDSENTGIYKTLFVISRSISSRNLFKVSLDKLIKYLDENILSDGAHISKCPNITFNILEDVVFIYKNLTKIETTYKAKLRTYIDKIAIFIKSLRYLDGGLGIFYNGFEENSLKIDFILSLGNINASPFHNLRYSGYLSLANKQGINIFLKTSGYCIKSNYKEIDNSILSQEVTIKKERIIVNNSSNNQYFKQEGGLIQRDNYSTMLFYDKNGLVNMPGKLNNLDCKVEHRVDPTWNAINASYKGLKNSHGLIWHKSLFLEKNEGNYLLGEELLTLSNNNSITKAVSRFILHPKVLVKEVAIDNKRVVIEVDGNEWLFRSTENITIKKDAYKGIKGEIIPNIILDVEIDLNKAVIEWSLIKVASLVDKINGKQKQLLEEQTNKDSSNISQQDLNEANNNQEEHEAALEQQQNGFVWANNITDEAEEEFPKTNNYNYYGGNQMVNQVKAIVTDTTNSKVNNLEILQKEEQERKNKKNITKNKDNYIFLKLDI
ncbi:heparinase II/III family protein [Rickettsiales bacterium LUAb2]